MNCGESLPLASGYMPRKGTSHPETFRLKLPLKLSGSCHVSSTAICKLPSRATAAPVCKYTPGSQPPRISSLGGRVVASEPPAMMMAQTQPILRLRPHGA